MFTDRHSHFFSQFIYFINCISKEAGALNRMANMSFNISSCFHLFNFFEKAYIYFTHIILTIYWLLMIKRTVYDVHTLAQIVK